MRRNDRRSVSADPGASRARPGQSLFPGLKIVESHPFHVTRDAEVAIKEIESDDLIETISRACAS
jgi:polyphosphate kinase